MVNSLENFGFVFDKALEGKFIDRMDQNQEIFARYMNDRRFCQGGRGLLAEAGLRTDPHSIKPRSCAWKDRLN